MKAGVIGHPIAHSKSPLIHGHWLGQYNIKGLYRAIDIAPENLKDGIKQLVDEGYDGFNVTVPHKQSIMQYCDDINETACAIGAVNTVVIKDSKLYGQNTDAYGFIQNIKSSKPEFYFKNKTAFVLGAGGAARAVVYGLIEEGVSRIYLSNRTKETAQELGQMSDIIEVVEWNKRETVLQSMDLVVNTTSLGMVGKPPLDMDLTALKYGALVHDIVYAPLMTPLLSEAQDKGYEIVSGIGMLLHQARPAFKAWTGIMPEVTDALVKKVLA